MRISGLMMNYYFVCKRKLWCFSRNLNFEETNENVKMGKLIDESRYSFETKQIAIEETVNIDFIRNWKVVHEIKKSKAIEEAAVWQVKYYIYFLKKRGIEIEKGIIDYPEIRERKAEVMRIAKGCEGARKTTGQHPGGMIVVPKDKSIYDFCPIQRPANDMKSTSKTTHFDYHVMDEQLVKLDILGHDDPTTLRILQDLTGVDIYTIPLDDKEVMSLFSGTEALGVTPDEIGSPTGTSGIPEFGTSFVKQMLVDTRPKTFAELVRISGLSHGTDVWLNNAQDYVRSGIATLSQIITVRDDIMNKLIDDGLDKSLAFSIMEFVRKGQPTKNPEKWKEF